MPARPGDEGRVHTIEISAVCNRLSTCSSTTGGGVGRSTKVSTNGGVQHQRMFREMRCDIAVRCRERCSGRPPSGRVGVLSCDIGGDGSPTEAPDVDPRAIPEMCEHAAGQNIEAMTVTCSRRIGEGATAVIRPTACTVVADDGREHALRVKAVS